MLDLGPFSEGPDGRKVSLAESVLSACGLSVSPKWTVLPRNGNFLDFRASNLLVLDPEGIPKNVAAPQRPPGHAAVHRAGLH